VTPNRRALYGLMLAALLVRLAIWPWFAGLEPQIYDEGHYVEIATNLAERGEFRIAGETTSIRPPLYPALVAIVYRLAGVGQHQAVRLLQILLNVALVPLVFALGRRLYDERTGLAAAAIAAFYPSLWGHDYLLLTEVLFTVLLVAGTWALVESSGEPRRQAADGEPRPRATHGWLFFAAGVAFGLGTLTRPTLLFYPPLFAIVVFTWSRAESARRIAAVAVFVGAFAITLAPWIARNTRLEGRLSAVDSFSGLTAARFSPLRVLIEKPGFTEYRSPPPVRVADQAAQRAPAAPAAAPVAQKERARGGQPQPRSRIARAVRGVIWDGLLFWRIDRELAGAAARGWLGPLPRPVVIALAAVIAGYYVALMLAGTLGVVLRPPPDRLQLALVLSVVAVLAGVHALSVGHSRYHIPLMPLVALFAARLWTARSEPVAPRRLAAAVALALLLIGGWTTTVVRFDLADARRHLASRLH
jgi:4-amino-4-deoxy-L-arabinose transferase-like glycosyltransferase